MLSEIWPQSQITQHFCEWRKTKMESSQVLGTDCCDLGTHCDRKSWWESRKEDIFLRGVIVNVFHNAQREDMSLVKQSVYWVQRGKEKEMHWLKSRILSVIKKKRETLQWRIYLQSINPKTKSTVPLWYLEPAPWEAPLRGESHRNRRPVFALIWVKLKMRFQLDYTATGSQFIF